MVERAALDALTDRKKQPLFDADPRTVRVSLDAGGEIAEHSHPEADILFFVVEGSLELGLDEETYDLAGGEMVRFDGSRTISGTASEPTTAVVVLAEKR
ncbi:MAG: cupin domain-containing protein [Halapricum sp.]